MSTVTDAIAKLPEHQRLPAVMHALEDLLSVLPVHELRSLVSKGEALIGKGTPVLPSGAAFDKQTRKGRLYLDLIDDLEQLNQEYGK